MTAPTGDAAAASLLVRRMVWEADGVLSLRLERPDRGELPAWQPGAHLDLQFENGLVRQYSICSPPGDRSGYEVGVLLETAGRGGSRYVHESLRPGMTVQLRAVRNHFPLVEAGGYLFIAGGVGITPLLPMIEQVQSRGARWRLLYAGRARRRMAFLDRLAVHDERVILAAGADGERLDLQGWFSHARTRVPGAHVYCCGPEKMLDQVQLLGADHGIAVHLERFTVPAVPREAGAPAGAFRVELARTGSSFDVGPDESILDKLLDLGLDLGYDCRDGICGSCITPVLGGEVDHRDYVLTEKEKREGKQMLVCVSRCRADRLVLDL
jgi:ferredoxin-NADP reductase